MKRFIVFVCVLCLFLTGCDSAGQLTVDIHRYEEDCAAVRNAADFMPSLDSLGSYERVRYSYHIECISYLMGFYSHGLALFVTYDEGNYAVQKALAPLRYHFLEEPVKRGEDYLLPLTEFDYRGYSLRVIPDADYIDHCACKSFAMLGVNEALRTVVYLYFYDFDIDLIAKENDDLEAKMRHLMDYAFVWVDQP